MASTQMVLYEKTGRVRDIVSNAVQAWADSAACDFRDGAMLATLVTSISEQHSTRSNAAEPLDLSTRALGVYLKQLAVKHPARFESSLRGWKCAPPLSYLVSTSLPPNRVLADRRQVKKGEKAIEEVQKNKNAISTARRAVKKTAAKQAARAAKGAVVGSGQGKQRSRALQQAFVEAKAVCPTLSLRQLPMVAALLVAGFVDELSLKVTPAAIAEVTPTKKTVRSWIDRQGELDDLFFERMTGSIDAVYAQFDAGNKGGREWLWQVFSFWDPAGRCVQMVTMMMIIIIIILREPNRNPDYSPRKNPQVRPSLVR